MVTRKRCALGRILKSILFTIIALLLFFIIQGIFVPSMLSEVGYPTAVVGSFFALNENEIDPQVFFIGTSHVYCGISPMELYKAYGIVAYDLGTASQPKSGSLYFLKEIFKKHRPKVIVFDVSSLFKDFSDEEDHSYRYIIDNVPMSKNKLELLSAYAESTGCRTDISFSEAYLSGIVPMFQYHDRWDQLNAQDFDFTESRNHFLQGQDMRCNIIPALFSVESMNENAARMEYNTAVEKTVYTMGERMEESTPALPLYQAELPEDSLELLQEMYRICRENGSELLLIKVPVSSLPFLYGSAWTLRRSQTMHEAAAAAGLDFLDLMYDVDLGIDWDTDTPDGGNHMNPFGAEKVTAYVGEYLKTHYDLPAQQNSVYDSSLEYYEKAMAVARFQTVFTFSEYLELLKEHEDHITVLMAACDEMSTGLTEGDVRALRSYGLRSDFAGMEYQDTFIALIENGNVVYEAVSNREQTYNTKLSDGTEINMLSAGAYCGRVASIQLNGTEYSRSALGINIVVYDEDAQMVIDVVTFNTWLEEHLAERTLGPVFDSFDYISRIAAG